MVLLEASRGLDNSRVAIRFRWVGAAAGTQNAADSGEESAAIRAERATDGI